MSYVYDGEVQKKLGLAAPGYYSAIMYAVDTGKVNSSAMLELARELGGRVGGGHLMRMEDRGRTDRREMKNILSDWYNIGKMHEMDPEEALRTLDHIFRYKLDVVIEPVPQSETPPPKPPLSTVTNINTFTTNSPSHQTPSLQTLPFTPLPDAVPPVPGLRAAFLVANTYETTATLKTLEGTLRSTDLVKEAVQKYRFQTTEHINKSFEEVQRELKAWKDKVLRHGDVDALLFYFCGHGGWRPLILISSSCIIPGQSPFESRAEQDYEDTLKFPGAAGSVSVGGDVIIDNNNKKLFKDKIIATLCKVRHKTSLHSLTGLLTGRAGGHTRHPNVRLLPRHRQCRDVRPSSHRRRTQLPADHQTFRAVRPQECRPQEHLHLPCNSAKSGEFQEHFVRRKDCSVHRCFL